ncbi:hypothetical protein FHS44_000148 [Streptosporangium saharense]|uniref:Transposase DDE domain-containing protein n=1 Tax=Streptosporangium saharense TaxID=1706840 RepID=A0A7W7QHC0_9ACTN|nr:hypothetical protein [Streptosporangium saharense]
MEPLIRSIPPIRSQHGPRRRRPARLHGDKGCEYPHLRAFLRSRSIVPYIARRGIEFSRRPSRHRWIVERTVFCLSGCCLHHRYERRAGHFAFFVTIAMALIRYRRLAK